MHYSIIRFKEVVLSSSPSSKCKQFAKLVLHVRSIYFLLSTSNNLLLSNIAYPDHFEADPDPEPSFHFDADPDPTFFT
jgi:hypothetical protein